MLLNDVRILENIEILSEAKSPQGMKIRGLFQRADEENNNKRVYPKTVLESQVKGLQDMITENRLCGELDHPSHDIVKLSNASHLITGLYMEGNDVIGEAKVLDTPAGKVAQALIEGGVKIGISSRGVGTLSEDTMRKVKYVNEDYKLVTFDLVADPSTRGAFPTLSESTESGERTRKIVNDTYKKALGEKVFVTMLKESFNTSLQESDKSYEKEDTSYDEIMKMRGYPSVDDVLKRNKTKEDPFYKAMMAAVTGATPVKAKESKKNGKVKKPKGSSDEDDRRVTDIDDVAHAATHGRKDDNTQSVYSKMAQFLGEVYLKEGYGNEPVNTGEDDEAPGVKSKKGAPKKKKKKKKTKLDPNNPYAREERGSGWGRDPYIGTAPKKKVNESERIKRADMSHGLKREDIEQAAWDALTPAQKARLKRKAKQQSKEAKKPKKLNNSTRSTYGKMAEILGETVIAYEEAMLINENGNPTLNRMTDILIEGIYDTEDLDKRKQARAAAAAATAAAAPGASPAPRSAAQMPQQVSPGKTATAGGQAPRPMARPSRGASRIRSFYRGFKGSEEGAPRWDEPSPRGWMAGKALRKGKDFLDPTRSPALKAGAKAVGALGRAATSAPVRKAGGAALGAAGRVGGAAVGAAGRVGGSAVRRSWDWAKSGARSGQRAGKGFIGSAISGKRQGGARGALKGGQVAGAGLHKGVKKGAEWGAGKMGQLAQGIKDRREARATARQNLDTARSSIRGAVQSAGKQFAPTRQGFGGGEEEGSQITTGRSGQPIVPRDKARTPVRKSKVLDQFGRPMIKSHTQATYNKMAELIGEAFNFTKTKKKLANP